MGRSKYSNFVQDAEYDRPEWQQERGERHGNNRKWKAKEKWIERKRDRKRNRFDLDEME